MSYTVILYSESDHSYAGIPNFTVLCRYCIFYKLKICCCCCCCSVAKLCLTLCDPMDCSTPDFSVLHFLPESAQIHVHWVCDNIQPLRPLSPSSSAFNLSQLQGLFQWASLRIGWPEYWSFSFSLSSSNKYSGLISFRIDWFDLLAVQRTLESSPALQLKSINFSALSLLYGPTLRSVRVKVCGNPASSESVSAIFSNINCSLYVSVSNFGNSCNTSNLLFWSVINNLWCYYYDLLRWLAFFSNMIF